MEKMSDHQRKKTRREYLELALVIAGVLPSTPATNTPPSLQRQEPIQLPHMNAEFQPQLTAAQWFERRLHIKSIDAEDLSQMEDMIMRETVDLSLQIKFFQRAFRPDGPYMQSFNDPHLSPDRFWNIISAVGHVSAQIRKAHDEQTSIKYFEHLTSPSHHAKLYFSTHTIKSEKGGQHCNGFLYRDAVGAVRFDTDKHCMDQMPAELKAAFTANTDADAATMLVTPDKYRFLDPPFGETSHLPFLDTTLSKEDIVGQPVISFSFDPKVIDISGLHPIKIHYSIAMPWTDVTRKIAYGDDVDKKDPFAKGAFFMIKPPEEGYAQHYDEKGKPDVVGASGSSGSLVALTGKDGVRVIGSFMSVRVLNNTCHQLCYTISSFNTPATHARLGVQDR